MALETLNAPNRTSTALLTDHYELTMVAASLAAGTGARPATFEVFARTLPAGRKYGVFAGLERVLDAVEAFRFDDAELSWLSDTGVVDRDVIDWLSRFRFSGSITAYREGELYFPHSPVLTVEATFAEAVMLETVILSILNHDSAVASAAARMVTAAEGRTLIEMGGRRTHEQAAIAAARAAYLVGFDATSNLEAGRRYGIPTTGTAAHAFTLAHGSEAEAFAAQIAALGPGTTLLVDTYDIAEGIRTAVKVANEAGAPGPGAIRIDSGDLAVEAAKARALLDSLGAAGTRIVVSGDLDEYLIGELVSVDAPIDAFGAGTRVVGGSGHPTAGFVYKLVAIADRTDPDAPQRPVAKRSAGKANLGGRKRAWRLIDSDGYAHREHVVAGDAEPDGALDGRELQVQAVARGERLHRADLDAIRAHHRRALAEMRPLWRHSNAGSPALSAETA